MVRLRRSALVASLSVSALALSLLAATAAAAQPPPPAPSMQGFSPQGAAAEQALEARFDASLNAGEMKAWMERMSAEPNQVGAPHDKLNADWTLQQFRDWGFDAHVETFYVLYPTPIAETLELVGPTRFKATLHEPAIPQDPTSADMPGVLPPYLAYQGDGDVTAPLVYANYGMPDDYKTLARAGVDVRGKIVIARYGDGWRGLKPKLAQLHGAVGCIIYSDPHEDGYYTDDPYPKGNQRPPEGVQRGSVQDITLYSGDPLTPGIAATRDAQRLTRETAKTILKIPALPISYADATPLLAALGGQVAPGPFRGALPITYHIGPGPALVHLAVRSDWSLKPIYDVIAMMPGREYPDQWVIRGNHHDGWVFGAEDPLSGNVAELAEAKAVGALARTGWRPRRTLVYASWDGEEPGLLGSTEWAEAHADELKRKAVIYVNSDTNARGYLGAEGSHDFQRMIDEVTTGVRDPETGSTVGQRLRARMSVAGVYPPGGSALAVGGTGAEADRIRRDAAIADSGRDLPIGALGSGSDYTPFLQHLGLAAINLGFGGEGPGGGYYHSAYDTYTHFERFEDPGFGYGVALAQTAGRIMLRSADAEAPPMQFAEFADTIATYVDELHALAGKAREKSAAVDRLLASGDMRLTEDPMKPEAPPPRDDVVPAIDLKPLDGAVTRLKASAARFDGLYAQALASGRLDGARGARLNAALVGIDETLLDPQGLPGRPWYENLVYAPGMETGYGVKTLPGVREAIEGRRWPEADAYAVKTAAVLDAYTARIDAASAALAGG